MRSQVLPWVAPGSARILDLGCGRGAILKTIGSDSRTLAVGVDVSLRDLQTASSLIPHAHFVCARGEQLPFPQQSFDAVISGVAMPYMEIPRVLAEIARVLKPAGSL